MFSVVENLKALSREIISLMEEQYMQLRKQRKQILKQKQRENFFDVSDQIPKK